MSETHKTIADAPAFPQDSASRGLTKREYFAALAMQALVGQPPQALTFHEMTAECKIQLRSSVLFADLLIRELNKPAEGK